MTTVKRELPVAGSRLPLEIFAGNRLPATGNSFLRGVDFIGKLVHVAGRSRKVLFQMLARGVDRLHDSIGELGVLESYGVGGRMYRKACVVLAVLLAMRAAACAESLSRDNIVIIFDASGSMSNDLDRTHRKKLAAATKPRHRPSTRPGASCSQAASPDQGPPCDAAA